MGESNTPLVVAFVFKIIHISNGVQYVARVMYNGLTYTELVFETIPTQAEIEQSLGIRLHECRYEPGIADA